MPATIYCKVWNIQGLQPEFDWETIVLKQIPRESGHVLCGRVVSKIHLPTLITGVPLFTGRGPHVALNHDTFRTTQAPLPCHIWWLPLKYVWFASRPCESYWNTFLLPPNNEAAGGWCFHRCVSVHWGGVGRYPLPTSPPPPNGPKRVVFILPECILILTFLWTSPDEIHVKEIVISVICYLQKTKKLTW